MPIIGVTNPGEGDSTARAEFVAGMSTQISHVLEGSEDLWVDFGISSQPTMVFVNADGTWERAPGAKDPNALVTRTKAMATH